MKDHTGDRKEYSVTDYGVPTVMIGFYSPGGGTSGEFAIRWRDIGEKNLTARLEAYNDGWSALANMPELLAALARIDGSNPSVNDIVALLRGLDYQEWTG